MYLKHRFYIIYEVLEYALLHNELDQISTRRNKKAPFPILTAIFKFKAGSRLPIKQPNESKFAQSFGLLIAIYCVSCDKNIIQTEVADSQFNYCIKMKLSRFKFQLSNVRP